MGILQAFVTLGERFFTINVPALAKPADTYSIDWYTVDGGGAMNASGRSYTLSGTIGQPDVGTERGGVCTLNGGSWVELFGAKLYLPIILR